MRMGFAAAAWCIQPPLVPRTHNLYGWGKGTRRETRITDDVAVAGTGRCRRCSSSCTSGCRALPDRSGFSAITIATKTSSKTDLSPMLTPRTYSDSDDSTTNIPQPPTRKDVPPDKTKAMDDGVKDVEVTSEILSMRFRDVLLHFRNLNNDPMNSTWTESIIQTNLLRTRHDQLMLKKCRVDVSTVPNAGCGVFVTQDIFPNELITLYPGDAIIQWNDKDHIDERTLHGLKILFGTHIPQVERTLALNANKNSTSSGDSTSSSNNTTTFMQHIPSARDYEVRISDTISLIGDPVRCTDPAYLGQMINDYCTIQGIDTGSGSIMSDREKQQMIRDYNIRSIQASNCKIQIGIDGCHVEIVSTRQIPAGTECFLSYGTNYWMSRSSTYQPPRRPRYRW
jgi:SET domain